MQRDHDGTGITALILSGLIVIVYLIQLLVGMDGLAFVADRFWRAPWTIITSVFLHNPGDYMHLLNNLFFLALFGFMLERFVGTRRFLLIFLSSGIVANLSAFMFYPSTPVLGASGAVSGIVAALAVVRPRTIGLLWGVPAPMWAVLLGWIGINALGFNASGNIAFEAHLFGLIYGVLIGAFLRDNMRPRPRRHRPRRDRDPVDVDVDVDAWEERYMRREK